jgi:hypothetical protein
VGELQAWHATSVPFLETRSHFRLMLVIYSTTVGSNTEISFSRNPVQIKQSLG